MVAHSDLRRGEACTLDTTALTLRYERRATLYLNGDPAQSVLRVRDGLVRITRVTPDGRTLTVRHVMPGDFFGEDALTDGEQSESTEALTPVSIDALDPERIEATNLMHIARSLSAQMGRLMDFGYHLQTGDLRSRVARYLLALAQTPLASREANGHVVVAATHELIAEGTASTRESVSKIITDLKGKGLVRPGYRSIALLDDDGLVEIAQHTTVT